MDKIILSTPSELSTLIEETLERVLSSTKVIKAQSDELPELLNISQAAGYLSLAKQTLYGFTSKGVIPHIKRGKKLYFKKSELIKWVNKGNNI
jgi:excisionase family DNA binding protein